MKYRMFVSAVLWGLVISQPIVWMLKDNFEWSMFLVWVISCIIALMMDPYVTKPREK